MEITCHRCHQAVPDGSCFCPTCGLPQLVYATEDGAPAVSAERWTEAMRDAGQVDWKPALRVAILLAIPAGLLSSVFWRVGILGLFWMAAFAAWAVSLYVRRQKTPWITTGAGARIGLVTGLLSGWLAFSSTGVGLYIERFLLHQGGGIDYFWDSLMNAWEAQAKTTNVDAQSAALMHGMMSSPEGRAGFTLALMMVFEVALLVFAAAGGAIGARIVARSRRSSA